MCPLSTVENVLEKKNLVSISKDENVLKGDLLVYSQGTFPMRKTSDH